MSSDLTALSDEELCEKIELPESFIELEFRYLWLVKTKAKNLVKNYDLDDFIQEGLLGLYYAARSYDKNKSASFKTYADVCIRNRICNELRKNIKQNHMKNSVSFEDLECSVPSPEEDLELRDNFKAVLNQIHITLSEFEQKVLAFYLSGYKRAEIPSRLGVNLKAYDNALARCRKKLQNNQNI